ncbi:Pls/PosA family non-ribosomal peptide synthetase [Pseudonocardia adelaidensis]|uniref:Carrier domain-containing protein n=1 Tax=Pseudonocardia adelaidensis TaxID=648754 RepID=A0ABP9N8G1_9PSEU
MSTQQEIPLTERDDIRRSVPMSELVLVDRYEAQGWRVRKDERLDHLFEERCDWVRTYGRAGQLAIDSAELSLTYEQLDARANQLARFLRLRGANAGDRIGLLFGRPADAYVAVLAVLKIGAAYVPVDVSTPAHRIEAIVEDARIRMVLSSSDVLARADVAAAGSVEIVRLDRVARLLDEQAEHRLTPTERGLREDSIAYITYRPGPDGRPTGVAVDHRSICNFVRVAAEVYGIRPWDRVYQGAHDVPVEETWVPWAVGATLVPRPAGVDLRGRDLHAFLTAHRATAMRCTADLLGTLERDLPDLRFLLVAGQACPQDLVRRWHKPGRRFLSVYGPSEATVSATWTELRPDKPATIGIPLPTYSTVILDPADPFCALQHGRVGEIGIAGIGLTCGYLNRDDLTEKAFIPDFLGIPANPSGRIFRTGDLGRVNPDGEIEYHGRLDGQRTATGFGTGEIGSATPQARPTPSPPPTPFPRTSRPPVPQAVELPVPQAVELPVPQALELPVPRALELPVPQAVAPLPTPLVDPLPTQVGAAAGPVDRAEPPTPSTSAGPASDVERDLAGLLAEVIGVSQVAVDAHFFDDLGADSMLMARFCARLRKRDGLPNVAMRDVYEHPTVRSLATAFAPATGGADPGLATELAAILAEVMGVSQVAVDAHFFDDLGADSMLMARFCARLRKRDGLPNVAMKDVYAYPTVTTLATAFGTPASGVVGPDDSAEPPVLGTQIMRAVRAVRTVRAARHRQVPTRKQRYVLCGVLQLLFLISYPSVVAVAGVEGYEWILVGPDLLTVYLRSVAVGSALFFGMCALPILLKWVLVGRWKPQEIPVWSMAYFRFWLVRTLVQRSPMALFVGSPLYVFYLRMLGAKIGRGAVVLSGNVPVCTDMLEIGDGAVIRKDSFFPGYRAHDGAIQTGAVSLGNGALVGEATVLDIWTSLGDGAELAHSSSLHAGQTVPDGERWHGSPAQRAELDARPLDARKVGVVRRTVFVTVQLANLLLVGTPLAIGGLVLLLTEVPQLATLLAPGALSLTSWTFYLDALTISTVLLLGGLLVGLLFVGTVPRLLNLAIRPDRVYPLYGFHYWVQRAITRTTNQKFCTRLFGDSSYIVHYLRWLGYDFPALKQTGANFGEEVKHDTPFLSTVGSGTMVADGLSIINSDYSNTSFRLSRVSIGAHNFLGNRIAYPAQGRTGDDCLLATKLMVPVDGPVREGVGLLGAPGFDIPRSVERDKQLLVNGADELRRGLRAKNVHNTITIALSLLVRWIYLVVVTVLYMGAVDHWGSMGAPVIAVATVGVFVLTVVYFVLVDRLLRPLQALRPMGCSLYDRAFWRHERFWKVRADAYFTVFNGTPLKNVVWRLLGVRMGHRVFDDGCYMSERSFVTIGDNCTLNAGSVIQCHSQEDGGFKSDRTVIGAGCTIGVGAFILYGVSMGDGAVLAADSFLMKGEEVPVGARWGGNPAKKMREQSADLQVRRISIDDNCAAVLVRG